MRRCLFALLLSLCPVTHAAELGSPLVSVDERIELAAVVARLAGFEEFQGEGVASYDAAVAAYFLPFAAHPAVLRLRQYRHERNIGYGDTVALAVLAADAEWTPAVPVSDWLPVASTHWDEVSATRMMRDLAAFAEASRATAFFASQRGELQQLAAGLQTALGDGVDVSWFSALEGMAHVVRLHIIVAPLHGRGNYGPRVVRADGSMDAWAVIGVGQAPDAAHVQWNAEAVQRLLVHETAHAWANPWVDRNAAALRTSGERRVIPGVYGQWRPVLYETVARALTIRYFLDHARPDAARRAMEEDVQRGFEWTAALAERWAGMHAPLHEHASVAVLRQVLAAPRMPPAWQAWRLQYWPARGATGVAPGQAELHLQFDRPMRSAIGVFGEKLPDFLGPPQWSPDGRALVMPVRMAAGREYEILLNDPDVPGGFRSAQGERLPPLRWQWRTAAQAGPETGSERP